jgi:hypothetical protein
MFEETPKVALLYWFAHLELPMLITSLIVLPLTAWSRLKHKLVTTKDRYLLCFTSVLFAVSVTSYVAGSRNLLLDLGALCLLLGAFFDDAFGSSPHLLRIYAAGVLIGSVTNLSALSFYQEDWVPFFATDGY